MKKKLKAKAKSKAKVIVPDVKKSISNIKRRFDIKKNLIALKNHIDVSDKLVVFRKRLDFRKRFDLSKSLVALKKQLSKSRIKSNPRLVLFSAFLLLAGIASIANQNSSEELTTSALQETIPAVAEEAFVAPTQSFSAPAPKKSHTKATKKAAHTFKKKKAKHAIVIKPIQETKVIGIVDGDTLDVLFGGVKQRVRLAEIDSPEMGQAFSRPAKQLLAKLAYGKNVQINVERKDKLGRLIAWVSVNGKSINKEMIRKGYAWAYRQYLTDYNLLNVEAQARESHSGLWSEKNPTPPWNFRGKNRVSFKR